MPQQPNQRQKLLKLLRENVNEWVPLPRVLALNIAQYSARIFELRGAGYEIKNRTEHRNGVVCSWFMLVVPKEQGKLFEAEPESKHTGNHFLEPELQQRL